ncbi:M23 family metallopeptidase [Rubricoccus marinus]|uniref:M23 family metallopeptidase n=1 Tax=Rubricoccus marinus TaxID=716817 RepID=UPI00268455D8
MGAWGGEETRPERRPPADRESRWTERADGGPGRFPAQENTTCPLPIAGPLVHEKAPFRRVDGHGARKGKGACPLAARFGAVALWTRPSPLLPESPDTSPDTTLTSDGGGRVNQVRAALHAAAQSPWPSSFSVLRAAVGGASSRRRGGVARALRIAGALSLSVLALSAARPHHGPLGQAFVSVGSAFDRVRSAEGEDGTPPGPAEVELLPPAREASGVPASTVKRRRPTGARRLRGPVGLPVRGPVSSPFGPRVHPVSGRWSVHRGVDLAVPVGTPVHATGAGRVAAAGVRSGYGLTVEVAHAGATLSTLYAHLDAVPAGVEVGAVVRRGTVVGWSGGVGPRAGVSTGPHVHYEVRVGGVAVDVLSVTRSHRTQRLARKRPTDRHEWEARRHSTRAGIRPGPPDRGIP